MNTDKIEEFLNTKNQKSQVIELTSKYPEKKSFNVDYNELDFFDGDLASSLLAKPDEFIREFEKQLKVETGLKEKEVHARFYNLPDLLNVDVLKLGEEHINKLIKVEGVVSWVTQINPRIKNAVWECLYCGKKTDVETDKIAPLTPPNQCSDCGRSKFKILENESEFINSQRAKMQDLIEKLQGSVPTSHVLLWMEDDLVNTIFPGDKITITGILRIKPLKEGKGKSSSYDTYLDIVHIHKIMQEFEQISISKEEEKKIIELSQNPKLYEMITQSIAPGIYGYNELKSAIALQLFGGTPNKTLPDGQRIRSDAHILLIGDPGTAKSSMLQYVARLAPKCVLVSGKGASGVGLTASAEKDEMTGGWILKAGAMVLASGGQVNIDELDKMDKEDRSALHEAMEQQSINISKAGIIAQFQTRTSVLAAANPKFGRFDPNDLPTNQFDIPSTLLSRFDLIFTIKDILDESRDRKMADHIMLVHSSIANDSITPVINLNDLRKYIAYARKTCFPKLSSEAGDKIKEYYVSLRKMGKKENTFPITARQIEGIIRLAEASAKIRLSPEVELIDAERAINLTDFVLKDVFTDKETGLIDSDIVNIGQSKSKTDKTRNLINIIQSIESQVDMADIDEVVKKAMEVGLDEMSARKIITDLKIQGELYEPKPGFIKSVRRRIE